MIMYINYDRLRSQVHAINTQKDKDGMYIFDSAKSIHKILMPIYVALKDRYFMNEFNKKWE